jgi:hypothetical protein
MMKVMLVFDAGDEWRDDKEFESWEERVLFKASAAAMRLTMDLDKTKMESDRMDIARNYADMFYEFIRTFVTPRSAQQTAMYLRDKAAKELEAASRKRDDEGGIRDCGASVMVAETTHDDDILIDDAKIILPSLPEGFRVVFLKQIHSCFADTSAGDAWMHRELTLPFAPGHKMLFTHPDGWVARAIDVQWDGQMFVVYAEADKELYNRQANNRPGRDIRDIVAEWEAEKWELLGFGGWPPIETEEEEDDES